MTPGIGEKEFLNFRNFQVDSGAEWDNILSAPFNSLTEYPFRINPFTKLIPPLTPQFFRHALVHPNLDAIRSCAVLATNRREGNRSSG